MSPRSLRAASIVLGLLGGIGQLGIAFMGDAIGGISTTIVLLVADAIVALAGVVVASRWASPGAILMAVAGVGSLVALFSTTLLEVAVAVLLLVSFDSHRSKGCSVVSEQLVKRAFWGRFRIQRPAHLFTKQLLCQLSHAGVL